MPTDYSKEIVFVVICASLLFLLLSTFIILFLWKLFKKKQQFHTEKQLLQAQHGHALLQTQIEIQEQTLRTISQEIHDNIGQVLSLARLNLKTLDIDTGVSRDEKIDASVQLVSKAINDLRDLSRSMNGDKISDLGLVDAIDNELKIIRNTGLINTSLCIEGTAYILQSQDEIVIFRVVQESLNNAVKHSKARNINIHINYQPSICSITIADDGEGFNANQLEATQTGIGLKNMQRRASLVNAYFSIFSEPGKGTKVLIQSANKPA